MKSLNKKAVIFDLDGTILDTIADIAAAVNRALAALGYPSRSVQEVQGFLGNGSLMLMRRALPNGASDSECITLRELFRVEYEKGMCASTVPYKGITELLNKLNSAGAVCAVVSNKDDKAAISMVKHYFGNSFAYIRGVRGDTDRKPNPTATLSVLSELGFTPNQALFVGDGIADYEVSVNAGIDYIPVGYGYTPSEKLFEICKKTPFNSVFELEIELMKYF